MHGLFRYFTVGFGDFPLCYHNSHARSPTLTLSLQIPIMLFATGPRHLAGLVVRRYWHHRQYRFKRKHFELRVSIYTEGQR